MSYKLITTVTLAIVVCFFAAGASAQLVPISYGFPTIVQSNNAVAFEQDTANSLNYQAANIDFGGGLAFSPGVTMAFPSISQTSLQVQSATHTEYSQTSSYAEFAYPYAGVGAVSIPGFGF